MNLTKKIYILITLLLSVNFWTVLPIGNILKGDLLLIMQLIWFIFGYMKWGYKSNKILFRKPYIYIPILMWLAVFISFIPAYYYQNQSFIQSLITSRTLVYYIGIWILLLIQPTEKDVIKALDVFSVLFLIVFLLNSFASFYITADKIQQTKEMVEVQKNSRFFGNYIAGFQFVYISLAYRVQKVTKSFSISDFYKILLYFGIIFLVQNRSNLLPAAILLIIAMLKFKSKYKYILIIILTIILLVLVSLTSDLWYSIIYQTKSELNNNDYNRIIAFNYFIFDANPSWINFFIGNGFISSHASDLKANLMTTGIYNSDMGFIGMWNYYGIIPIIIYFTLIVKSFLSNFIPFYVKAISFHILIGSLTISHFMGNSSFSMYFFIFIYLYTYYSMKNSFLKRRQLQLSEINNKKNDK